MKNEDKKNLKKPRKTYHKNQNIVYDKEGWAEFPKYKPRTFDLVRFRDDQGKQNTGWWTGQEWDFLNNRTNKNVVKWQYVPYE